ncbi:MAG: hypothetical protein M1827_003113 [Pycnora praestabilis]|nr:MAG: hypothetical protein M1827_003113 [Pycnora praestabilis]
MRQRDAIGPHGHHVHLLHIDLVGGVQADNAGQQCPGAEHAGAEVRDLGVGEWALIGPQGVAARAVALDRIEDREGGCLGGWLLAGVDRVRMGCL